MPEAIAINAQGGVPPVPAGVTVHERGSNPAPQPAAPAAPEQPTFNPALFNAPQNQPAPAQAPATDPALLALLGALTRQEQGQPAVPAPAPQQPSPAPVAGSDPVAGSLQAVLSGAGVDVNAALSAAFEYGDSRLIDKAAFAKAPHLVPVAEALVQHRAAVMEQVESEVYTRFGGEANFDAALAHFGKSAQPIMKEFIKSALDSGDRSRILQAADFVMQSVAGAGVTVQKAGLVGAGAAGAYGAGTPLSKEEFKAELQKLKPSDPTYEAARNELFYRRQQGKNQGR